MTTNPSGSLENVRRLAAALLAAALAGCGGGGDGASAPAPAPGPAPAPAPAPQGFMQGTLLTRPFGGASDADGSLLDLAADELAALPRSATSLADSADRDNWSASMSGLPSDVLVRVDTQGNVDFFDRGTMARTGGFSLAALPGVNLPAFRSDVKVSPDGQHVLAYWSRRYDQDEPLLAVFDRGGAVVQQASSGGFDGFDYRDAFDWLPDGRFIFFARTSLYTATLGVEELASTPVVLPAIVESGAGSTLTVSPDGRMIAWTLSVDMPDAAGAQVPRGLVFVSDIQGGAMRQLTTLSKGASDFDGALSHWSPRWSPDQRYVAFRVAFPPDFYGAVYDGCEPVIVLPAGASSVAIDGLSDPDSEHFMVTNPHTGGQMAMQSCFVNLSWLGASR